MQTDACLPEQNGLTAFHSHRDRDEQLHRRRKDQEQARRDARRNHFANVQHRIQRVIRAKGAGDSRLTEAPGLSQ